MAPTTVLFVATSHHPRLDLADELMLEGYVVFCARGGTEAAFLLGTGLVSTVIVVDGRLDGREAAALLRTTGGAKHAGRPHILVVDEARDASAVGPFMPVPAGLLVETLRQLAAKTWNAETAQEPSP